MRIIIQKQYEHMCVWAAQYIKQRITFFAPTEDQPFVLGLPTGSTPLGMYRELIRMHKEGELSFKHVITFNMDEYVGLSPQDSNSYHAYMQDNFFSQIDIPPQQVHLLDGSHQDLALLGEECNRFEEKIQETGGIHLFVGSIGQDGHLAFNEPGSSLNSRTRIKTLTEHTRKVNARFFGNDIDRVPKMVLTVGLATITDAQEVMLLVSGNAKAKALKHCVEEGINHMWTASCLQLHPHALFVCDEDACKELKYETVLYFKDVEKQEIIG